MKNYYLLGIIFCILSLLNPFELGDLQMYLEDITIIYSLIIFYKSYKRTKMED